MSARRYRPRYPYLLTIQDLPPGLLELALERSEQYPIANKNPTINRNLLCMAFDWDKTPEGAAFWKKAQTEAFREAYR